MGLPVLQGARGIASAAVAAVASAGHTELSVLVAAVAVAVVAAVVQHDRSQPALLDAHHYLLKAEHLPGSLLVH
jgi:hypothetical protein